jgi:hypothetical protein
VRSAGHAFFGFGARMRGPARIPSVRPIREGCSRGMFRSCLLPGPGHSALLLSGLSRAAAPGRVECFPFGGPDFGFYRDPFPLGLYRDYRRRLPLPTEGRLAGALTERVLEYSGAASGFVDFEALAAVAGRDRVPPAAARSALRRNLRQRAGAVTGDAAAAFAVGADARASRDQRWHRAQLSANPS